MAESLINDVSDTALWVATYRADETLRPDALFKDPLADRLAGARGREIASKMSRTRYTGWSVVIRTYIIDQYIQEQVAAGVDLVLNLGAGLDTRPYRLDIPSSLRWIEVDHPQIIQLKEQKLAGEKPKCHLERFALDLSQDQLRRDLLNKINAEGKRALVLTEGVVPYLTEEQVARLAQDLRAQSSFKFWIVDYFSANLRKHVSEGKRKKEMANAPIVFFPQDWLGFFRKHGWQPKEMRDLSEAGVKAGRPFPLPLWARILLVLTPKRRRQERLTFAAYVLLEPK